jgi:replicative DNA helicase
MHSHTGRRWTRRAIVTQKDHGDIGCTEAEAALLGALLLSGDPQRIAAGRVDVDDFAEPRHRVMLGAIRGLHAAGRPVDPITVLGQLRTSGVASSFTGSRSAGVFIADVAAACPIPANADYYAAIVLEHSARRRIREAALRLEQASGTSGLDALSAMVLEELVAIAAALRRASVAAIPEMQAIDGGAA